MQNTPIRSKLRALPVLCALALSLPLAAHGDSAKAREIERGRYVVKLGGCNDCHTAGYAPAGGKVPELKWLTGDALGFQGGWGTTYPSNLRLYMSRLSPDEWVRAARQLVTRPPMPWFTLHDMSDADLRAMHAFVASLGPAGVPAPAYVPPGGKADGPVVLYPDAPPAAPKPSR